MEKRDFSEHARRKLVGLLNSAPSTREELESVYAHVLDSTQLASEYHVVGFLAPFVAVRRKCDGAKGTLVFQHHPRFYWEFKPDESGDAERESEIKILKM